MHIAGEDVRKSTIIPFSGTANYYSVSGKQPGNSHEH